MSASLRLLVAVACLAVVFVPRVWRQTSPVPEPVAELKSLAEPVRAALASHAQRAEIAAYFGEVASAIERDGGTRITSCEVLRKWNEVAASRFRDRLAPVSGLADKLNAVFLKWVGDDSVAMDAAKCRRAAEAARAIQWAAGG